MIRPFQIAALLALAACAPGSGTPDVGRLEERGQIVSQGATGPAGAAPGTCWGRDETPARVRTVTEAVVVTPARLDADGKVITPEQTRTVTRQEIVEERHELWFETPCPDSLTPDGIATLQRALRARGYYHGSITGTLDAETRSAVRQFQAGRGLNSAVLSLDAARQLGLAAVPTTAPDPTGG